MKMVDERVFCFCNPQARWIHALGKLHIIDPIQAGWLFHPLTNRREGAVQDFRAPKIIAWIVWNINELLMNEDGRESAKRLEQCGMISKES